MTRAEARALWLERRAGGLCVRCGEPALPDRAMCAEHRDREGKAQRVRQDRLRRDGLCTTCGAVPPEDDRERCSLCLAKLAVRNERRRRANGVPPWTGRRGNAPRAVAEGLCAPDDPSPALAWLDWVARDVEREGAA